MMCKQSKTAGKKRRQITPPIARASLHTLPPFIRARARVLAPFFKSEREQSNEPYRIRKTERHR